MSKIYEDVVTLQEQVAELTSRVTALENNSTYNIAPGSIVKTHEKYNGKDVYCKVVDVGALPNSTDKTVSVGRYTKR